MWLILMTRGGSLPLWYRSFSTKSMSKACVIMVSVILSTFSAKVFPKQIRLPPLNGEYAKVCLFPPEGVRERGWVGSKRSGRNSNGRYHWLAFTCSPIIETMMVSLAFTRRFFPSCVSYLKA